MKKIDYSHLNNESKIQYLSRIKFEEEDELNKKIRKLSSLIFKRNIKDITDKHVAFFKKWLLLAPFKRIVEYREIIKRHAETIYNISDPTDSTKSIGNSFYDHFDYKSNQSKIAAFMADNLKLSKVCYYCDELYISSFNDFKNDYSDFEDFLIRADYQELCYLEGIADGIANKIIDYRSKLGGKPFKLKKIGEIGDKTVKKIKDSYNNLHTHNYFTLDHVLNKAMYPFFSLSLFNLVPSCYPCNCKFKSDVQFEDTELCKSSPTSIDFDIASKIEFKVVSRIHSEENDTINLNILKTSGFKIVYGDSNNNYVSTYMNIFKLKGRYLNYRSDVNKLLEKRIKYSDTKFEEMERILITTTKEELKEAMFSDYMLTDLDDVPLKKFKTDIAKQFKII